MTQPLIYMALAVGITVFIYGFTLSYAKVVTRRLVESKHRDAQAIIDTWQAPAHWRSKLVMRVGVEGLARAYALHRIERLYQYFKRTPLVDGEGTRNTILTQLASVRAEWRQKTWAEIAPQNE